MKILLKFLVLISLLIPLRAEAVTFGVLVLPADITNVCNNYYCFDEVSNIVAADVIANFSHSNNVAAPNLDVVRARIASNQELQSLVNNVLRKYNRANNLDMPEIQKISQAFGVKSVLLISSSGMTRKSNLRRGIWEILDLSSRFDIVYPFEMETNAVLIDSVNGLVMWSGSYKRKLGNNNDEFNAKSPSQAAAKFEQIVMYSEAIAGRSIAQNVILRFFPKTSEPVVSKKATENVSPGAMLKMNNTPLPDIFRNKDIKNENESDFGEILYGL